MSVSFDRIADRYDATRGFPPAVASEIGAGIMHHAAFGSTSHVLEIGVGTGRVALPTLAAAPAGLRYTGIDISPAMLARLRARLPQGTAINLLQADATRLPLPDQSVDAVVESHVLHLVASLQAVLGEIRRVLRPGGALLSLFNHHPDPDPLARLRHEGWQETVTALGGAAYLRESRGQSFGVVAQQREYWFGIPERIVLARWQRSETPREVLDQLASRTWSSTWEVPEPLFQEALRRLENWARTQFTDLDRPQVSRVEFVLERFQRPAAR